jgi:hypothetical protein
MNPAVGSDGRLAEGQHLERTCSAGQEELEIVAIDHRPAIRERGTVVRRRKKRDGLRIDRLRKSMRCREQKQQAEQCSPRQA